VGLNRRSMPILQGGLVLTHYLITWSGNGRSTRHLWWVTKSDPAHCQEFSIPKACSTTNAHWTILFWLGKTTIARIDSRRYKTDASLNSRQTQSFYLIIVTFDVEHPKGAFLLVQALRYVSLKPQELCAFQYWHLILALIVLYIICKLKCREICI
jgi:hypothetical protein